MTVEPTFLVTLFSAIIALGIMYGIIYFAVVQALRRARREAWTETYDSRHATWLHPTQRETLAKQTDQVV